MVFSLFVSRLGHLRGFKRGYLWRRICACILWGNVLKSVIGKTESCGDVRSNQLMVVPRLCSQSTLLINSLNAWATNCATFRNQKLYCCTVFLLKTMKQRTLQVCSRANYTCLNRAEQSSLKEKVPPPWEHKLQLFFSVLVVSFASSLVSFYV